MTATAMLQPCVLFPKFLQAGISITTVLADGLKKEDGSVWCWHRASETSVLSQFCLGFQSPFLCKFKAWSCSSMFSGFTVLKSHISRKSVSSSVWWKQQLIWLLCSVFLNKDGWFPSFCEKGKVGILSCRSCYCWFWGFSLSIPDRGCFHLGR